MAAVYSCTGKRPINVINLAINNFINFCLD